MRERDEKLSALLADKTALDEELKRLRAEVAAAKKANAAQPDTHDYSEAETRDYFIDLLLKEAGWPLDQAARPRVRGQRHAQRRRARASSTTCSGATTASRWRWSRPSARRRDARVGPAAGQALRRLPGEAVRPAAGHLLLQRLRALALGRHELPAARGAGLLQEGRAGAADPAARDAASRWPTREINAAIVERYYQTRAIRRIGEAFEKDHDRKALVVMATGAGKTRTVIALCDLLMRCNWVKRVLFLADRVALVNQAVERVQDAPARLVAGEPRHREGRRGPRVRLDLPDDDGADRRDARTASGASASGTSTWSIIDEAHRSVYQKYRAIFDYFDSLLVGLTATPKDEVDRNTYSLFDLENGVPTDAYALDEAVQRRVPRAAAGRVGAAQVPARGHQVRRAVRGGEGAVGRAGVGRGRQRARPRRGRGGQQVAVQQGHRGQGAGAPDDARAEGGRRRPARQDHHLRQEPGPRRVHRRALQRQLPALQGRVRPRHHVQDRVRAEPDRRLLEARTRRRTSPSRWTCSTPASTSRRS